MTTTTPEGQLKPYTIRFRRESSWYAVVGPDGVVFWCKRLRKAERGAARLNEAFLAGRESKCR